MRCQQLQPVCLAVLHTLHQATLLQLVPDNNLKMATKENFEKYIETALVAKLGREVGSKQYGLLSGWHKYRDYRKIWALVYVSGAGSAPLPGRRADGLSPAHGGGVHTHLCNHRRGGKAAAREEWSRVGTRKCSQPHYKPHRAVFVALLLLIDAYQLVKRRATPCALSLSVTAATSVA
jgi:hypothetical protein